MSLPEILSLVNDQDIVCAEEEFNFDTAPILNIPIVFYNYWDISNPPLPIEDFENKVIQLNNDFSSSKISFYIPNNYAFS